MFKEIIVKTLFKVSLSVVRNNHKSRLLQVQFRL